MCRQSSYNSPRIVAAAVAAHRAFFIVEENTLNVRQADVYSRALVVDARQHVIEDKWRRGRRVAAAASREDTHIGSADAGTIAL